MKSLFRQKQWIVTQVVFAIIGIMVGVIGFLDERDFRTPVGGLASTLQMMTVNSGAVFFIILSDLAFTVEYLQGTFLTSLLCGQNKKTWMFRRSVTFYLFVLIQYALAGIVVTFTVGLITGHFGLEGLRASGTFFNGMTAETLSRLIGLSILRMLVFVSLGVLATIFLPGKLVIGSTVSIGAILIISAVVDGLMSIYRNNRMLEFITVSVLLTDPAKSWVYALFWFVLLTWLSVEQVKKVKLINHGA